MVYLWYKSRNPYSDEHRISVESFEDVTLSVDFASVDFVEERHQNEAVEDHREMLRWFGVQGAVLTVINVQQNVSCGKHAIHMTLAMPQSRVGYRNKVSVK